MEKNENGLTQKEWINKVDELCMDEFGAGIYDILGDFESWTPWNYGEDPEEYWHNELYHEVAVEAGHIVGFAENMMGMEDKDDDEV